MAGAEGRAHVWMDQGGTFTDVVRMEPDGSVRVEKVPSDLADLVALGSGGAEVRRGTTVGTNALLERTGVPVLLVTSRGLEELPWVGDQTRPALFALQVERPPTLCSLAVGVDVRVRADGSVEGEAVLDPDACEQVRAAAVRSAAVVLPHGPLRPELEIRIGAQLRALGVHHVSLGHEVAPSRGLLDRIQTTLADAAVSPLLPRAPGAYMRSDGGLAEEDGSGDGEWRGRDAVLSGPAGGVVAVADLAARLGLGPALGLDMGGTSTDVCRVDGSPARVPHLDIGGLRLRVPAVRLETVAAGGGSRLGRLAGAYAVGPRSAGASPGPAAYGRGGPATLTDCEVVLGRVPHFPRVCGPTRDGPLDVDAARAAVSALDGARAPEAVAAGFRDVGQETMAAAVRALCARLGVDPAGHVLVAFGGAGPAHACGVARRLGIRRVVVPGLASVFSAVGVGRAHRRAEVVVPVQGMVAEAVATALAGLPFDGHREVRVAMRYAGTLATLEVALTEPGLDCSVSALEDAFHQVHARCFGAARPGVTVEAVEVRVAVEERCERPLARPTPRGSGAARCRAWFGRWREVPLVGMADADGVTGPALLTGPGTTVVVETGWRVRWLGEALLLEDTTPSRARIGTAMDPVHAAVMASRLGSIAEEMGARLCRLARSVSIRERLDFSCAVFDASGHLVVNAPHVPVHLGAMGETVRALVASRSAELRPGDAWVSNDPYAGGSHLPDITVMAPVFDPAGERMAFVACRGHHVDVGGSSPGSMPATAQHIDEEGMRIGLRRLATRDGIELPPLDESRQPDDVAADLRAQVAACRLGVERVEGLATEVGARSVTAWMSHLQDLSEAAVRVALQARPGVHAAEERLDDGTRIGVQLTVSGDAARVRIDAPAHPGNRNAPAGVARAALLYVFRCLVPDELPLNEGALRAFRIETTPGGLFDPSPPAAVAGGNVESSQRLVDALLQALGVLAASQGTMNNLTVGTPVGAFYETIGGGMGAGPEGPGASAVQCHMTNTRGTDVEELEVRFPVVLEVWRRRLRSGGGGRHRGGDGVVKQWRMLAPAEVSLLVERRLAGAPGLEGGGEGKAGVDERGGPAAWTRLYGTARLVAGERLRVSTPGGGGWGRPGSGVVVEDDGSLGGVHPTGGEEVLERNGGRGMQ